MNGSSIDTVVPETKAPLAKQEKSARPLISRLYDGTAELVIRLPGSSSKTLDTIDLPETVELSLPSPGKHADNNDRIVSLVSMLTSYLLKDIESTKSHNLKEAQAEGRLRAKREGKQIGRPKKEFPDAYYEAIDLCREGKISIAEAAKQSGMTYTTFYANLRRENHGEQDSKRPARWKKDLPSEYYEAVKLCKEGKLTTAEGARHAGMDYWSFYRYMKNMNHREAEIIWGKS